MALQVRIQNPSFKKVAGQNLGPKRLKVYIIFGELHFHKTPRSTQRGWRTFGYGKRDDFHQRFAKVGLMVGRIGLDLRSWDPEGLRKNFQKAL